MTFQELSFYPDVDKPKALGLVKRHLPAPHIFAFAHVIRLGYLCGDTVTAGIHA